MPVVKKIIATSSDDFVTGEAGPDTASVSPGTAAALKAIERNIAARGESSAAINRLDTASRQASSALVATGMPAAAMAEPLPDPVTIPGMAPFVAAGLRALLTAILTGATTFLATFSTTSDAKTLWIATATAVVSVLVARLGAEGVIDQARAERAAK